MLQLVPHRDDALAFAQADAEKPGQGGHRLHGLGLPLVLDHPHDDVQGVVEEMGVDLGLQGVELALSLGLVLRHNVVHKQMCIRDSLKTNLDVTSEPWFRNTLEKTENLHFSIPQVQYIFDANENQYRWVISVTRAVAITQGPYTDQGVLLIDIRYNSLEQLFDSVSLGNGGYVYLISSEMCIRDSPGHGPGLFRIRAGVG